MLPRCLADMSQAQFLDFELWHHAVQVDAIGIRVWTAEIEFHPRCA